MKATNGKPRQSAKVIRSRTESSKHHTFQSFSAKVANIKIDPVRRIQRHQEDSDKVETFFRPALEQWMDSNLSGNFVDFTHTINDITESLPQLLFHQNEIMDAFIKHIEQGDKLSMEPLLSLLAQFARDLGPLFEKHFGRTVTTVANVISKTSEIEVIEWAFNFLAYLLKYLSRLLVADLRPTFEIFSPLLGAKQQKQYIIRYAAEAFSFLLRKAKSQPLRWVLDKAFETLVALPDGERDQYSEGLQTMLLEACMGVGYSIHSKATQIITTVLQVAVDSARPDLCAEVYEGFLTGLIHRTTQETFEPVQDAIFEHLTTLLASERTATELCYFGRLLFVIISVRRGGRISKWGMVGDIAQEILNKLSSRDSSEDLYQEASWAVAKCVAVFLDKADFEFTITKFPRLAERLTKLNGGIYFLPFCEFAAKLSEDKLKDVLFPYLQKFLIGNWEASETYLSILLPTLAEAADKDLKLSNLSAWKEHLSNLFDPKAEVTEVLVRAWQCLDIAKLIMDRAEYQKFISEVAQPFTVGLVERLKASPEEKKLIPIIGRGLASLSDGNEPFERCLNAVLEVLPFCADNTEFLSGFCAFITGKEQSSFTKSVAENTNVVDKLIESLCSADQSLRRTTLRALDILYSAKNRRTNATIELMQEIGNTDITINNHRNVSMHIRKLGSNYESDSKDDWLSRMVPRFLFGLLTVNFAPIWTDSVAALQKVTDDNEALVAEIALRWLTLEEATYHRKSEEDDERTRLTPYQCTNYMDLTRTAEKCLHHALQPIEVIESSFEKAQQTIPLSHQFGRTQALLVLCDIPFIAEKRSKQVVPLLLEATKFHLSEENEEDEDDEEEKVDTGSKWNWKDREGLLTLFSKFGNPKALYMSDEVFSTYLELVGSKDSKVQALALKCLVTFKIQAINAYKDELGGLIEDSRFRETLTSFIQVSRDESLVRLEHREQLMPVLLRVLYGRSVSRQNAKSTKRGMASRRQQIIASLANFSSKEQGQFIDIMLGNLTQMDVIDKSDSSKYLIDPMAVSTAQFSTKRLLGLTRMIKEMFEQLGADLLPLLPKMVDSVLFALRLVNQDTGLVKKEKEKEKGEITATEKALRLGCAEVIVYMFRYCPTFTWAPYMPIVYEETVSGRLENLPADASQTPTAVLRLFDAWTLDEHTIQYLAYNEAIMQRTIDVIGAKSIKDEVLIFVFNMLIRIMDMAENNADLRESIKQTIVAPNLERMLSQIGEIVRKSPGKDAFEKAILSISKIAAFVPETSCVDQMLDLCSFLLDQPLRRVNPKTKKEVLRIIYNFLPTSKLAIGDELYEKLFKQTCVQFAFFNDRESRVLLSQLFEVFSQREEALREVASLLTDLNSFSAKHLDEPDFQRRLTAFAKINDEIYGQFSPRQWSPIVQNMLFYVKEQEELAIRRSASFSIKRFIECCAAHWNSDDKAEFMSIISESVYPAVLQGSREKSELIRLEYITALSNIVSLLPEWEDTKDLVPLLVDGDEEANFFNNILNIQQHRRLKALRRLSALSQKHNLRSTNVSQFLLPLIEHFVFDPAEDAHNLSAEAVNTMGALGSQLTWQQFRAVFKRYISYIKSKEELIKVVIRLIGAFADCMSEAVSIKEKAYAAKAAEKKKADEAEGVESMDTAEDGEEEESDELDAKVDAEGDIVMSAPLVITPLASTLPRGQKLGKELTTTVLPIITRYLHDKDEATVSLRVPVAVTVVKLLKLLTEDEIGRRLPGVLMDVSHILRSRSQESRDLTRKTLADITRILGPRYFSYVLDQLRNALMRGYQLHVLSYTVHSLLVSVTPDYGPGELDYCLGQIVAIVMDDIFGVTGQEKDEEDYISKMKEVKSSKSYDSMELVSKMATTGYLAKLVRPIQDLVQESLTLKTVKKIDELLRRINCGLLANPTVQSRDLLVFCYELIQEGYKVKEPKKVSEDDKKKRHEGKARYLVNLTVPRQSVTSAVGNTHPYKLIRFALDILRISFQRNEELMTTENVANFVPLIGDALLSPHEEVSISALRLLNTIIKVPIASIDEGMLVFTQRAMQLIKNSPSTNAEIAQASLKFLTSALRERKTAKIKESMVAYLLTRIKTDLEEPDRQGISFNFLKAVISRRVVIPEVYDVADHVAHIMITNQTRAVRDLARSVFFQFLMDFPQGKDRLNKQLAFLVKNLDYVHSSGRQSVLELIHHLLTKVGDNLIQQIVGTFFVPLVMVLVNDDSVECREMTGSLLKELFERADKDKMATSLGLMRTWIGQTDKAVLIRVALQLYGIYIDVLGERSRQETEKVLERITEILTFDPEEEEETPWEQIYFSLQICSKVTKIFPDLIFSADSASLWKSVISRLTYPHAWVKLTASRLVGMMFGQLANEDLSKLPLTTPNGLSLDSDELLSIARMSASQLNNPEVSDELGLQSVKNLLFLGRVFDATGLPAKDPNAIAVNDDENEEQDEEDEEEEAKDSKKSALLWIMGRLSAVIRNERNIRKGTKGKKFALQWLAAICQLLPSTTLEPLAEKIILPLYNLIDNPANEALLGDLKTTAQEILQICQQKMSNTVYSNAYSAVRQQVLERRRLRKHKRSIQLVADPERAAGKKIKKHERKKVARKEKGKEWRDKRRAKNF